LVWIEPPKVAVTLLAALTVTLHAAVPVQAPDQPAKVLVATGVSVSVTCVPGAKLVEQAVDVAEQLIPVGVLVTVPPPAPARETVNAMSVTGAVKVAVMLSEALSVTEQVLVPEQLPPHPVNE
jgi:hypothetical protein